MSAGIVDYSSRADATPEGELAALGAVYGYVLSRHAERKAAGSSDEEGARTAPNDAAQERRAQIEEAEV